MGVTEDDVENKPTFWETARQECTRRQDARWGEIEEDELVQEMLGENPKSPCDGIRGQGILPLQLPTHSAPPGISKAVFHFLSFEREAQVQGGESANG